MAEAVGVGLLIAVPLLGADLVFVDLAGAQSGDEQLPAAAQAALHRVHAPIPAIEQTQDRHAAGIGGPQAIHHPGNAIALGEVGAHLAPDVMVVALGEQQPIELAHPLLAEGPGVVLDVLDPGPHHPQLVATAGVVVEAGFKHPRMVGGFKSQTLAPMQQVNPLGIGHPDPHRPATGLERLGTQHGEGMIVATLGQAMGVLNHPVEAERGHENRADEPGA